MTRSPARRVRPATSTSADMPRPITEAGTLSTRRPSRTAFSTASGSPAAPSTGWACSSARSAGAGGAARPCRSGARWCGPWPTPTSLGARDHEQAREPGRLLQPEAELAAPAEAGGRPARAATRPGRPGSARRRSPAPPRPGPARGTSSRRSRARPTRACSPVAKAARASSSVGTASGVAPVPAPAAELAAEPVAVPGPEPAPVAAGDGMPSSEIIIRPTSTRARAGRRRPSRPWRRVRRASSSASDHAPSTNAAALASVKSSRVRVRRSVVALAVEQVEATQSPRIWAQKVPDPALADDREVPVVGEDAATHGRVGRHPPEARHPAQPTARMPPGERAAHEEHAGHRGARGGEDLQLVPGRGQGATALAGGHGSGRGRSHGVSVAHGQGHGAAAPPSGDGHFTPSEPVDDRRPRGSAWLLCRACQRTHPAR